VELSPQAPTTSDTLAARIVLGWADSACVPSYTGLNYSVSPDNGVVVVGLPGYVLRLSYSARTAPCDSGSGFHGPTFRLGPLPAGHYRVVDSVSGLDLATFRVAAPGSPVYTLAGTVVDPGRGGEPMAGVLVTIQEPGSWIPLGKSTASAAAQLAYRFVGMTRSDARGQFAMGNMPAGIFALTSVPPGYDSVWTQVQLDRDIALTLLLATDSSVGSVEGTVRVPACPLDTSCGYAPAPGCSVSVAVRVPDTNSWEGFTYRSYTPVVVTDSNGFFRVDSVQASTSQPCRVMAWSEEVQRQIVDVPVLPSHTTHVVVTTERQFSYTATVTQDSVDYVLGADKPVFLPVERPAVRYLVRNRSGRDVTFDFDSMCTAVYEYWDRFCGFSMIALNTQMDTLSGYAGTVRCTPTHISVTVPAHDSVSFGAVTVRNADSLDSCVLRAWVRGYDSNAVDLLIRFEWPAGVAPAGGVSRERSHASVLGNRLVLHLTTPQRVSVLVFTADGRRVGAVTAQRFGAGTHALALPRAASRLLLVRVVGQEFHYTGLIRGR